MSWAVDAVHAYLFPWNAVLYAVQLRCGDPAGGWRYEAPLVFLIISGVVNALLNMALVIFFHLGVAGVAIATVISQMISCVLVAALPDPFGRTVSSSDPEAENEPLLPDADLSGRDSCGHPEHGYQYFQCDAPVIGQFIRLNRDGRLYSGKQCAWLSVCVRQFSDAGMHELYESELRGRQAEKDGSGASGLYDSDCGGRCDARWWGVSVWQ